jgi:hypothetical protein
MSPRVITKGPCLKELQFTNYKVITQLEERMAGEMLYNFKIKLYFLVYEAMRPKKRADSELKAVASDDLLTRIFHSICHYTAVHK